MVIDASVWSAYFLRGQVHHEDSVEWIDRHLVREQQVFFLPAIALPEIAGAIARRKEGGPAKALVAVREILALRGYQMIPLEERLMQASYHTAIALSMKGPDAVYVTLAAQLARPLITWDDQQRERGAQVTRVLYPTEA